MVISDEIRHRAQYPDGTTHIARSSSPKFDTQKNRARLRLAYLKDFHDKYKGVCYIVDARCATLGHFNPLMYLHNIADHTMYM